MYGRVGVWACGRRLEDRGWMIEDRKAYRNPFDLRSSIFYLRFFSHTPTLPHAHTKKGDYFLGMA